MNRVSSTQFLVGIYLVSFISFVQAQDLYFIQHKPTQSKMMVCGGDDGLPVTSRPAANVGPCVQWERIANGDYFHLRSVDANKLIKPDTIENGSPITIQPLAWRGNWTQWQYEVREDGYGHIINRGTGKLIFLSGKNRDNISQQPAVWRGDFTRWKFVAVDGTLPSTPSATPTPFSPDTPSPETPTPSPTPTLVPTETPSASPTPTVIPTSTPTPGSGAPSPASVKIEAEYGRLLGAAQVFEDRAASEGWGIAYLDNIGNGVRFNNLVAADGITVYYASMNTGSISVLINGQDMGDIDFESTGGWGISYNTAEFPVDIPQGASLEIINNTGDMAMNIDYITLDGARLVSGDTNSCDAPDPVADRGEGYTFGMTRDGLVYHRAIPGNRANFASIGLPGAGTNLPEAGPHIFIDSEGETIIRYEGQVPNVIQDQDYTIEFRVDGVGPNGQCTHSIDVKPGGGVATSPCFVTSGSAVPPPPPRPVAEIVDVNLENLTARAIGGSASNKPGLSIYTTSSVCDSDNCLANWPPVIVKNPTALLGATAFNGNWSTRERRVTEVNRCGNSVTVTRHQVTYNGQDLYFYRGDSQPGDVSGLGISGWDLLYGELNPQMPLIDKPAPALPSAINGLEPGSHGYVWDIDGSYIEVRHGFGFQLLIHDTEYQEGIGSYLTALGNREFEFWCSNNQIQWHKSDLVTREYGMHEGTVPGNCYGDYYYFMRYAKRGPINNDPASRWSYSGLMTVAGDRVDPATRPETVTRQANWMRFRHPHAHDGNTEAVFDSQNNNSLLKDVGRFETTVTDSGAGINVNVDTRRALSVLRVEALENGHLANFVPVYNYNQRTCCGTTFDYGNIVTFEFTGFSSGPIGSQLYTTHMNMLVGRGYDSAIGDPRLTLAGRAGTNMVFSDVGSHTRLEKDAVFTQHLTTLQDAVDVDKFLKGHHDFHGVDPDVMGSTRLDAVLIGNDTCGNCHFRDGRGSEVIQTTKGPRIAPPIFGVGLLEHIEGAEAKITWTGDVNSVREQVDNALVADHGVQPEEVDPDTLENIYRYTEVISVPNRRPAAHEAPEVAEGHVLFHQVGCVDCHTQNQRTSSTAPLAFRDLHISPYSDMKAHDVGTGGRFRTPPLWGLGTNIDLLNRNGRALLLMHDGRATSVGAAINAHSGEATGVMQSYNALGAAEKEKIISFIETL